MTRERALVRVTLELIDPAGTGEVRPEMTVELIALDTGRCPLQTVYLTRLAPRLSVDVESEAFKVLVGGVR